MTAPSAPSAADDVARRKAELRREMQARRSALTSEAARTAALAASAHLVDLIFARGARRVSLYAPLRAEIDPSPAAARLAGAGIALAYPRIAGPRQLTFHLCDAADLLPGRLGLSEPPPHAPSIPLDELDLVVAPGLAFDRSGGRLGWGGGYYDAALATTAAPVVGFFYAFQLVAAVPRTEVDHPVDLLVCDAGVRQAGVGLEDP